jgi:hypothetical protein
LGAEWNVVVVGGRNLRKKNAKYREGRREVANRSFPDEKERGEITCSDCSF